MPDPNSYGISPEYLNDLRDRERSDMSKQMGDLATSLHAILKTTDFPDHVIQKGCEMELLIRTAKKQQDKRSQSFESESQDPPISRRMAIVDDTLNFYDGIVEGNIEKLAGAIGRIFSMGPTYLEAQDTREDLDPEEVASIKTFRLQTLAFLSLGALIHADMEGDLED